MDSVKTCMDCVFSVPIHRESGDDVSYCIINRDSSGELALVGNMCRYGEYE